MSKVSLQGTQDTLRPRQNRRTRPFSAVRWLDLVTAEWLVMSRTFANDPSEWWIVPIGHALLVLRRDRRAALSQLRARITMMAELEHGAEVRSPAAVFWETPVDGAERNRLACALVAMAASSGMCVADMWSGSVSSLGAADSPAESCATAMPLTAQARQERPASPSRFDDAVVGPVATDEFRHDALGRPQVVTRLSAGAGLGSFFAFGTAASRRDATRLATYEALERHQTAYPPSNRDFVEASYRSLGDRAIDPVQLGFGACVGGADADPRESVIHWVSAWSVRGGRATFVPVQDVWLQSPMLPDEPIFVQSTTNGVALGSSLAEASVHAVLEAIERDAYLVNWYLRRTPPPFDQRQLSKLQRELSRALPDHAVRCLDLTMDTGIPVALAIAGSGAGVRVPRTMHSTAAGLTMRAAQSAAMHGLAMNGRVIGAARWAHYVSLAADLSSVADAEDHFGVHAIGHDTRNNGFLFDGMVSARTLPIHRFPDAYGSADKAWDTLSAQVLRCVSDILVVDLTHDAIAAAGLRCVKVLVPDFCPLWFGQRWRRVLITSRLQRLATALGIAVPKTVNDLNPALHALG